MNLNLKNKVAIVTGGSAGLGKAIALSLANEGVHVAISGRNQNALNRTATELESITGRKVFVFTGDMSKADSVKNFVDGVIAKFDTVHLLINNVGKGFRSLFTAIEIDKWISSFEINLMSAIYAANAVLPYMQVQKWGRIVNITALSATEPNRELAASNVVKSGLLSFSKTLSQELAGDNILVNCISPGLIESPQNERYFSGTERKEAISGIPLGRFGNPEELADVVTFLCSERASYITGHNLIVDGGMSRGV
jgi:3-oxoacyl-[acyl-carrier protein] reductase